MHKPVMLLLFFFLINQNVHALDWREVKKATSNVKESIDSRVDELLAEPDNTAVVIEKIEKFAPDFIATRRAQKAAPEKRIFRKDKADFEQEAQNQLQEIQDLLFDKKLVGQTARIKTVEAKIATFQNELSSLRKQKVDASVAGKTRKVEKLNDEITAIQDEKIAVLEQEIENIKTEIQSKFAKTGAHLSDEQVDHLCSRIDGDDILKAMTMVDIFKQILERTKRYIEADPSNLETTKKYYGVYVLIAEANVYTKTAYINRVNNEWIDALNTFKDQAEEQIKICRSEIELAKDSRIANRYRTNLRINEMSRDTAEMYKQMLIKQREKVEETRGRAYEEAKLAWSTYETASLSSDLISMIDEADEAFNNVMKIEMPELVPIEDSEIRQSFDKLTARLAADPSNR